MYGSGGGARPWTCKLCPYKRNGGANKVRAHLLHESGHEVRFCPNVTPEKRKDLLDKLAVYEVVEAAKKNPRVAVDPAFIARRQEAEVDSSREAIPSSLLRPQRQSTLHENWNPKLKEEVDAAVARFFYHDHIAFHAAR